MKDRPILFNAEMVRAILEGRKTQTRRVIKPQPPNHWPDYFAKRAHGYTSLSLPEVKYFRSDNTEVKCPYGQPGDRLWVREKWATEKRFDFTKPRFLPHPYPPGHVCCGMDYATIWYSDELKTEKQFLRGPEIHGRVRPSIHMPRWASRITLEVTGVRVERVQEISEGDAKAEGTLTSMDYPFDDGELLCPSCWGQGVHGAFGANLGVMEVDCYECDTILKRFRILWDSINEKRGYGWDVNPWVWVLEMEVVNA